MDRQEHNRRIGEGIRLAWARKKRETGESGHSAWRKKEMGPREPIFGDMVKVRKEAPYFAEQIARFQFFAGPNEEIAVLAGDGDYLFAVNSSFVYLLKQEEYCPHCGKEIKRE